MSEFCKREPCDICEKSEWIRISARTDKVYFLCNDCEAPFEVATNARAKGTTFIRDYGNVSNSRIDEVKRRVILPETIPGKQYLVGRRMENGKINENRQPDYSK